MLGAGPRAPQDVAIEHTLFQLLSPELGDTAMQWTVRLLHACMGKGSAHELTLELVATRTRMAWQMTSLALGATSASRLRRTA